MTYTQSYIPNPYSLHTPNRLITGLAVAMGIIEYSRLLGFLPFEINYYILSPLYIICIIICSNKTGYNFNLAYLLLIIYIPINILITNPPAVFQPWSRYVLFLMVFLTVSPVLQNEKVRSFRFTLFKTLIIYALPICCVTLPCYILGINYFRNEVSNVDYYARVGSFGGLFNHSMVLGPICSICTIFSLWSYICKKRQIVSLITTILCTIGALLSSSRSAIGGMVIGVIVVLMYDRVSRSLKVKRLLSILVAIAVSFPLWQGALHGVLTKQENTANLGEFGSRTVKFGARLDEISDSPITGIGFVSINPSGTDNYDPQTGVIEPGSSWLCTWSMLGIIGFCLLLYYVISTWKTLINNKSIYSNLYLGLLAFFILHLLFEGYIFSGGGVLCFIFWLIIGVASDLKYVNKYKKLI